MPKVSVLMPVYNAEKYLIEAVDSILKQTFEDWELIIINDGSTDSSKQLLEQYTDKRINLIDNEQNLGLIKTLNKGIQYCKGEYIARMDADDVALPQRLEMQIRFLENNPDYIMCGTNALVIDNNGKTTGKIRNLTDNYFLQINLLFSNPFVHPSMMIRKEILNHNLFDNHYKHIEDYELWCRIAQLGKIANLEEELLLYRWHDSNVSVLNAETQINAKKEISRQQLLKLGLTPTEDELYAHRITFNLYYLGIKQKIEVEKIKEVDNWFDKLSKQNKKIKLFASDDLIAFLWSRWIVLCVSQKQFSRIFSPKFASYNTSVIQKLFSLIKHLKKK